MPLRLSYAFQLGRFMNVSESLVKSSLRYRCHQIHRPSHETQLQHTGYSARLQPLIHLIRPTCFNIRKCKTVSKFRNVHIRMPSKSPKCASNRDHDENCSGIRTDARRTTLWQRSRLAQRFQLWTCLLQAASELCRVIPVCTQRPKLIPSMPATPSQIVFLSGVARPS